MPGGIKVSVEVHDADWDHALDAMILRLEVATGDGSLEAAKRVRDITRAKLLDKGYHSEYEWSPAARGEAPAAVSGNLAESITAELVTPDTALVGPTGGFGRTAEYARILELGGGMHGHPYMIFWKNNFRGFNTKWKLTFVELGPYPYLEPATREAVQSDEIRDAYIDQWTIAIEG